MSLITEIHSRARSPGTESFCSAREDDTSSLASFYLDAHDDLAADEYQSAEGSDRETTPIGQESSPDSTPRQTPFRETGRDELPNRLEKRHSHDYGTLYHREVGEPLILQRSSSYMRDGPFEQRKKPMSKIRSYNSVGYLNDSYDRSLCGRRPGPDRARQWKISLERLAQKECGGNAEPESRSEIRSALETPFDVPPPEGDELEKLKKQLSSLKSRDDNVDRSPSNVLINQLLENQLSGNTPTFPRRTKAKDLNSKSSMVTPNESISLKQSELFTKKSYEVKTTEVQNSRRDSLKKGNDRIIEIEKKIPSDFVDDKDVEVNSSLAVDRHIGLPPLSFLAGSEVEVKSSATAEGSYLEGTELQFRKVGLNTSGTVVEDRPNVTSSKICCENYAEANSPENIGSDASRVKSLNIFEVDRSNLSTTPVHVKYPGCTVAPSLEITHSPTVVLKSKPVFKESSLAIQDSVPKFARTASLDSTPSLIRKPLANSDMKFQLDRSLSKENFLPRQSGTLSNTEKEGSANYRDRHPEPHTFSWRSPSPRGEQVISPNLSALPPAGRISMVSAPDIPKRPARTKCGTRSARTGPQQSMKKDETCDSTTDLQEQIQSLLTSLQRKLNKSSPLGKSLTLADESTHYDSDGHLSKTASSSSLSWEPTRYSSIRREATMEKLETILSNSSETKKNLPAVFDAESIEELSTYGHIGSYEAANKKDSKIFEEFDKHFDLMLEADSGEEDDFVKIVDENLATQSLRMSVINGTREKITAASQFRDLKDTSFESSKTNSQMGSGTKGEPKALSDFYDLKRDSFDPSKTVSLIPKSFDSDGPPPVPLKQRASRDSIERLPRQQQQLIEMQNEQLKKLQKNQQELEEKLRLLQEQVNLSKAITQELPPIMPLKCEYSKPSAPPECYYNVLPDPNSTKFYDQIISAKGVCSNLQRSSFNSGLNLRCYQPNSKFACESVGNQVQLPQGDHRSPVERADTSGNLQIPYDDFVFEVGSPVGVMLPPYLRLGSNAGGGMAYGVVRWAGYINDEPMLGLEMDEDAFNGGYLNDVFYFECEPAKGFFARPEQCVPDERIQQMTLMDESPHDDHALTITYDSLPGDFPPLFHVANSKDLSLLVGRCKGIQGHHNSCYLDATLFAMFTTTYVFDFILERPREDGDIPEYEEVTRVLKEDIVNSIRVHRFVGAAQVMKLRELLDKLGSVSGLTCEEKDPEEFLNCLTQMLQVEPFLHLSSGQSAHLYQMFVEKDEDLGLPWFQQILEQSFFQQGLKLQQMPSVFIVQMPRFGRQFKVYPRVLPSLHLDMTDLLVNSPRPCDICASLAHLECIDCYQQTKSIEKSTFCDACYNRKHLRLSSHQASSKRLTVAAGFQDFSSTKHLPRQTMELFALLCIETSHYVAFVKCGQQSNSPWVFFDSMADRQGQNNIPEVVNFDDIYEWLSPEKLEAHPDDRSLPPLVKKIVSDAYMCFYRSNTVAMYN